MDTTTQTMQGQEVFTEIPKVQGEIVEAGSASTEITQYNFERVNLDDPKSILGYGQAIQDGIIDILRSTAQMSVNQEQAFLSDEMLKKITSFDEALEAADRAASKKEGLFSRLAKKVLISAGVESVKKEEEMKTYQGRYRDYVENIRQVVENVEILKQNALNDIELRKEIAIQMKPLIEELEAMIEAGKEDLAAYNEETKRIAETDKTDDGQYLVQRRSQIGDIFAEKINKLEKALILYKAQLQEYAIQQHNDMIIVMSADSYQRDQAPLLEAQGSVQVFNKGQGERIENLATLNEASNLAIINQSKTLEANTQASVDLMVNGGFSMDALKACQESLQHGVSIIEDGKRKLKDKIAKDQKGLDEINALMDENQRAIIAMIEETSGAMAQTEAAGAPHRRTLTTRKPRK